MQRLQCIQYDEHVGEAERKTLKSVSEAVEKDTSLAMDKEGS